MWICFLDLYLHFDHNNNRGLNIVKSRAFSMEEGAAPRDVLRRRVRTAEFYYGPVEFSGAVTKETNGARVELFDEFTDNFVSLSVDQIMKGAVSEKNTANWKVNTKTWNEIELQNVKFLLLLRPCIEHYMLGVIIGRGGLNHLGATLW